MRAFLVKKRFITFAIESFHLFKLDSSLINKTAPFMVIEKTKQATIIWQLFFSFACFAIVRKLHQYLYHVLYVSHSLRRFSSIHHKISIHQLLDCETIDHVH